MVVAKRQKKFYFKNEKDVMKKLGLIPAKGSGNTWIDKEDGSNDEIIAQLKSTDAESYKLTILDLEKLEYHALVDHKIPVFIIEFLQTHATYLVMKAENVEDVYNYLTLPKSVAVSKSEVSKLVKTDEESEVVKKPMVKSSTNDKAKLAKLKEKERIEREEFYKNIKRR